MVTKNRWRIVAVILLAGLGPPLAVWVGSSIVQAFKGPPPAPVRVERFTDYITPTGAGTNRSLPPGTQIWEGNPGQGAPFFVSMVLTDRGVALLSSSRFVAVDAGSREVLRDTSIQQHEAFAAVGATLLASAEEPGHVWMYSWMSGDFGLYDFSTDLVRRQHRRIAPSLRLLHWVPGRGVIANGPFEEQMFRIYDNAGAARPSGGASAAVASPPSRDVQQMSSTSSLGKPLFPGLTAAFARSLDMTTMAVDTRGGRMAVAYQYSDKVDIYDLKRLALERSVAGPVESKLDFAVAGSSEKPIFTLSEETQFAYVDVAVTDDVVLALYAGRARRKHGSSFGLGQQIHAFTWDGRPAGVWQLAHGLQQIEVDPATRTLYGLRWRPTTSVVAIDMAPILEAVRLTGRPDARQ